MPNRPGPAIHPDVSPDDYAPRPDGCPNDSPNHVHVFDDANPYEKPCVPNSPEAREEASHRPGDHLAGCPGGHSTRYVGDRRLCVTHEFHDDAPCFPGCPAWTSDGAPELIPSPDPAGYDRAEYVTQEEPAAHADACGCNQPEADTCPACIAAGCPAPPLELDDDPERLEGDSDAPRFIPSPAVRFVSLFLVDRAYGGPEEGGWWFDTGFLIECHPCPTADAEALAASLRAKWSNEGRRPISSVLSEGQYAVRISAFPGESYPKARPHYE